MSDSDCMVLGPAVNRATRLETASKTNRILIGERTAELLGGETTLEQTGPLTLKGIGAPVVAFFVAESDEQDRSNSVRMQEA